MPSSREGVGRGPALEIDVMMGFVMQTVVREGERRGSSGSRTVGGELEFELGLESVGTGGGWQGTKRTNQQYIWKLKQKLQTKKGQIGKRKIQ